MAPHPQSQRSAAHGTAQQDPESIRVETLLSLLADDSPQVKAAARTALEKLGKAALPGLNSASRSLVPAIRGRARQVLLERQREQSVRRLIRYASSPEHDLETALFLLDGHHSPGADLRAYVKVLDTFGERLGERIGRMAPGTERVQALVDCISDELGFAGSEGDYHHPDNICLHRCIDRRQGMPLTLAAIYAAIGQRAGLQVDLLPFPGHVLTLVREDGGRIILDPFGGGVQLSEKKCRSYLSAHRLAMRREFLQPASATAMFMRQVQNLIHSCKQRGRHQEAHALQRVQQVLSRHHAIRVPLRRIQT